MNNNMIIIIVIIIIIIIIIMKMYVPERKTNRQLKMLQIT